MAAVLLAGIAGGAEAQSRGGQRVPTQPQVTRPVPTQPDRDRTADRDRLQDQDRDHAPDQDRDRIRDRDRLLDLDGDGVPDRDRDRDRDYLNSASSLLASALLTEGERAQFHQQMQQATSDAERAQVRSEHRQQIRDRAEQMGIDFGPDGVRTQSRDAYMLGQMLTDQERLRFHEQMRQAETAQERSRLREELQEMLRERLRESAREGQ
ncbi:hypothetical protein [Brevundimonas sp.]|uniref:hypothetical protein n=1 Tax=Brevundimonas sp. TaxID=1871086 RepID=UPI0039E60646